MRLDIVMPVVFFKQSRCGIETEDWSVAVARLQESACRFGLEFLLII
jgi:hypothetical protein